MAEKKPFQASKRKLEKARKEGKILKSQLLTQAMVLLSLPLSLLFIIHFDWLRFRILLEYTLEVGFLDPLETLRRFAFFLGAILICCFVPAALVAIFVEIGQVGVLCRFGGAGSRLDVGSGFKKIFSGLKKVHRTLLKTLMMLIALSILLYSCALDLYRALLIPGVGTEIVSRVICRFFIWAAFALLLLGIFHYLVRRREYYAELSMSHDEVKREFRDEEGDPYIKAHRRYFHQMISMEDVVKRVRRSKVLIVEST